ncbi:serpin family protein [Actinomadura yumaensis]|uniref:Serpin family protein n=1 Tax=Actinomadura yumaensis TaxID=111807 RepID=A0ABW2D108_9ACTN
MAQHVLKATGAGHPDREVAREILDVVRRGWPVAPVRPKWHDLATVQTIIAAANALTGRWAAACSGSSTVAAGAGAWPLLALLASAADGPGRDELEKAVGLDAASARDAGLALVDLLDASPAISSALALWMRHDLALDPSWTPPARTRGTLTGDPREDQRRLDAWASERTGGLIPALPIEVTDESRLVLANALTVRTRWFEPFHGDTVLRRSTGHLGLACVAAAPTGAVTMACVAGTDDIDLHLVRGAQSPGTVLTAAIGTLDHRHPAVTAADLPEGTPGPGITVRYEESPFPAPALLLTVPPFTVSSSHDLLSLPDVFGLATVTDPSRGHFPGISAAPLAVGQAKQNALARFDAHGFEAAAVTAIAAAPGGAPPTTTHRARRVEVTFDPPFGFLTVHRPSGLVLTTGWISRPS